MKKLKSLHPYSINPKYSNPVAYFSLEYAIHQPLKIYAGGLGYIAGSYLRSAYSLKQNVIGIGILWKYGYYDQGCKCDQTMDVLFREKRYHFLQDTNIEFSININQSPVKVKAYYLPPEIFNTAPLYLLSTDTNENEYWERSITHKLYNTNQELRFAADILLGVGGAILLEALKFNPDSFHLNNSDALPLAFYLMNKHKDIEDVRKLLVYTFYNMEGSDIHKSELYFLQKINYFCGLSQKDIRSISKFKNEVFDRHLTTLNLARLSNGLSRMHENLMKQKLGNLQEMFPITHVTTGQNFNYWADKKMYKHLNEMNDSMIEKRKKYNKMKLFEEVAEQTGKMFDKNILTLVWAKRFTSYRRPELFLQDNGRFHNLLSNEDFPVQFIFAGKPQPMDYVSISAFDKLSEWSKKYKNFAVLIGHEMKLAKVLKRGADVWLHTQLHKNDASETSGISAAMNGCINASTQDGWISEFCKPGENSFIMETQNRNLPPHEQEINDILDFFDLLEREIIPLYYKNPDKWLEMVKNSLRDIVPYFDSDRMVQEYYDKIYNVSTRRIKLPVKSREVHIPM